MAHWKAAVALSLVSFSLEAGIVLETTDSLEVVTSSAASMDYNCSWTDNTTTTFTPGKSAGNVAAATTTTVVGAPAASTQRNILNCTFRNAGAAANTLTLQRDVSSTNRTMYAATLAAGDGLHITQEGAFQIVAANGVARVQATDQSGYTGRPYELAKGGTAPDAIAYQYAWAKDGGRPGAWVPGTPGVNGVATSCSSVAGATIAGAHYLPDPASGSYYLTQAGLTTSVAHLLNLVDVLWYNTGLVVTTTTGQAITPVAIPARDQNGSTNGDGIGAALYWTTTSTNAAVNNTATLTYTDSDGNAGNTATLSNLAGDMIPATAVLGTFVPFRLAAGDRGVRSVQTVTLATSLGAGAISLVLYRPILSVANPLPNVGGIVGLPNLGPPGVRIYNGSCFWPTFVAGAATATVLNGSYTIMER